MRAAKLMALQEFVEKGYLQELNRQFLHPLGLALQIYIDNTGRYRFTEGILDARDEITGMIFDFKNSDLERNTKAAQKAETVKKEFEKIVWNRNKVLGYTIEPIGETK